LMGEGAMIWILAIMLGCLVSMFMVWRALLVFRTEISHLPESGRAQELQHPILGVRLNVGMELPSQFAGHAGIVMFASPSCGACHDQLDVFEKENKEMSIPFLCLYEADDEAKGDRVREFVARHAHLNLQPITKAKARQLGVSATPLVLLIDANSVVRQVDWTMRKILNSFQANKRRAG